MKYKIEFELDVDEESELRPLKRCDIEEFLKLGLSSSSIYVKKVKILEINE